jgi:aminopeptidase N
MENKGLNIFNSKYILATPETATDHDHLEVEATIGHEYFHNWTGNRITCREWFQLSLKEGLTTFREQSFIEDISSVAARIHAVEVLRDGQFIEDQGPLAHPVQPQSYIDIDNFYTHTVYNKGAEIFRMLRTTLGKKVFRKGMDLYFERHDGQAVRIEDYIKVMEETSGHDLSQFLLWFHQAGTPLLEIEDNYDPINQSYRLKIKQSCPPTPGQVEKKPMAIPITMGLIDATGSAMPLCLENTETTEIERVLMVTKAEQEFYFSRVASRPTPSLLRGFSAPVRIHYPYTNDDLRLLARFDLDLFNRYEAANQYVFKYLQQLVHSVLDHQELTLSPEFIDTFRDFITTPIDDLELLSLIISLPSETELANRMERVHVEAIHAVLTFVTEELANEFKSILIKLYETHHRGEYPKEPFDAKESGRRDLKNVVLYYLTRLDNAAFRGLGDRVVSAASASAANLLPRD